MDSNAKHLKLRVFGLLLAAVTSAMVWACSTTDAGEQVAFVEKPAEGVGETGPLTLGFPLGETTPLQSLAVGAGEYVWLGDRVEVGAASAASQGRIEVASDAKVRNLTASGEVRIGHRTVVNGDVRAGGEVIKEPTAQVTGLVNANLGAEPPTTVSWTVQAPVTSLGDVSLEPDQQRDLQPARYGALSVKSRAVLTLHTGIYVFESGITIESGAKLRIDDREGPVQVVSQGPFTFRGAVTSARQSIPNVLFAVQGTEDALVESSFVGALIAPQAAVRVQAALPEGHRAVLIGKSVWLEPDTKVRALPFDWGTVVGPELDPIPDDAPIHTMPEDHLGLTVDIPAIDGAATTRTASPGSAQIFTLPEQYTVEGGTIGNGTVIFKFNPGTGWVTCTYQGQSSTSQPETADELIKGMVLHFQGCSDGLAAGAQRTGNDFELTVNPSPGYPVVVHPPFQRPNVCADRLEILTPAETRSMRQNFNWSNATKVPADNSDGTPTLYYAWIHIRDKHEALSLKKLFIHVLTSPLFDEELMQYAGRCGTFTNPGDAEGMFVPALIPGRTYNRLIDALTSGDVSGDRVIFDAVILRDVPAAARNPNGSINLQVLGGSGFKYLDYEVNPFAPDDEIVLDGGASKALTDALAWVAQAARDAGEIVTGILNEIDQLFRGEATVDLWVHAITSDPLFAGNVMQRGWGRYAGNPIGATGMQVKILQRMFDTPIPTTAKGDTNINGHVTIDATEDAETRGTGLCIELRNRAAVVTDFLVANEICDLRGYDKVANPAGTVENFRLDTLTSDRTLRLHIDNSRLLGFYQSDDVFRYSDHVMGYEPKRARILSGSWATTFSSTTETGDKRLFAPCLNFPNSLTEALTAAAGGSGAAVGALVGSAVPGIGTGVGAAVGAIALGSFASVIGNSDIVMSTQSKVRRSRGVMSHEYGHYMFCNMIYDADEDAVDHVIWGTVIRGDVIENFPLRYTNEAIADYFEGQVASGADYGWLQLAESSAGGQYCSDRTPPCWDDNHDESLPANQGNIGRVATLLLDVFDGQGAARDANVATNADAWLWDATTSRLVYNPAGDGSHDIVLENVALPAGAIRTIAENLAFGMEPFVSYSFNDGQWNAAGFAIDEMKIRHAVNGAMGAHGASWCDRCRVLALHEAGANKTNVRGLWESCLADGELQSVLGPGPDPTNLRLDADTCEPCQQGLTSDGNGQCVQCTNTVVGNQCVICTPDIILDGNTLPFETHVFDVNQTSAGDVCPNVLLVEVQNAAGTFARGADFFTAETSPLPLTEANCERSFSLTKTVLDPSGNPVTDHVQASVGSWPDCTSGQTCLNICNGLPGHAVTPSEASVGAVRFRVPALPNAALNISVGSNPIVE